MKQINNYIMRNSFFGKGALNRISAFSRLLALCALMCVGITNVNAQYSIIYGGNMSNGSSLSQCGDKYVANFTVTGGYQTGAFQIKNGDDVVNIGSFSIICISDVNSCHHYYDNYEHIQTKSSSVNMYALFDFTNNAIVYSTTPPSCEGATGTPSDSTVGHCSGDSHTLTVTDIEVTNPESKTVQYAWFNGSEIVGSYASYTSGDIETTVFDAGTYTLKIKIGDTEYPVSTFTISALPTTITATPASLSFSADGSQTITIEPTCASISDVTLTAPTGLQNSDFTITSNTANLRNGGTITVTLSQTAFDALEDGDYTGGNIQITGSDGNHNVGLSVSKVSCSPANVVNLTSASDIKTAFNLNNPGNTCQFSNLTKNGTYTSTIDVPVGAYRITATRCDATKGWGNRTIGIKIGDGEEKTITTTSGNTSYSSNIITASTAGKLKIILKDNNEDLFLSSLILTSVCPPKVTITPSGDPCTTSTATLTATVAGSSTYDYAWTTVNGNILSGANAATATIGQGAATYTVTVTDTETGLSTEKSYTVVCAPEITAATTGDVVVCFNATTDATVTFNNYSNYIVTGFKVYNANDAVVKTEDIEEITTPGTALNHTIQNIPLETRGQYSVSLLYTEGGEAKETEKTNAFTVKEKQFCNATLAATDITICNTTSGTDTLTLTGRESSDYDGFEYKIYTDAECNTEANNISVDGTTITALSAAAPADGSEQTYYVRAESTADGDNSKTAAIPFTVKREATCGSPSVSLTATDNYCNGLDITLTAATSDVNTTMSTIQYKFYRDVTLLATQTSPVYKYTVPANESENSIDFYVEVYNGETQLGIKSSVATSSRSNVSVAAPTLSTSVASPTTCDAFNVTSSDVTITNGTNGDEFTYYWSKNGNKVGGDQTATLTDGKLVINPLSQADGVTTTTTYTLTIEAGSGLCSDAVFSITVNPQPCKAISLSDAGYCEGQTIEMTLTSTATANSINYSWYKCNADGVRTGAAIGSGLTQSFTEGTDFSHANGDNLIVKVIASSGLIALDSAVAVIRPRTDCVQEYFVRNTDNSNTGDGTSWGSASSDGGAGAFKTIDEALNAAATLHSAPATADKRVAIYVYADADQSISTVKDTLRNISIYGGYSGTDYTSGTKTDGASGYTTITEKSGSGVVLNIGSGENTISRLDFNGSDQNTNRVINSVNDEENNLIVDNCKFRDNSSGGAIKFNNTSNGGELTIYDSYFSGNKAGDGGAVFVEGPYEVLISSRNGTPVHRSDETAIPTEGGCETKNITLSLLDTTSSKPFANVFDNNLKNASVDGGCVYIRGAKSCEINYTEFKNNKITSSNAKQYGGCIYVNNTNYFKIQDSYIHDNALNGQDINQLSTAAMGAGIYMSNIANAEINYCDFSRNYINNKGFGGSISADSTKLTIANTHMKRGFVRNGSGGAFYAFDASLLEIKESRFEENILSEGNPLGGGVYLKGAVVRMDNVVYNKNYSANGGGGFYIQGNNGNNWDEKTILDVTKCYFTENVSPAGNGLGGAFYTKNANVNVKQSYFYRNTSKNGTGPIHVENSVLNFFSSTMYDNHIDESGKGNEAASAIWITGNPLGGSKDNAHIYNSTFIGNGGGWATIGVKDGARADLVSNTIIKNNNGYLTVTPSQSGINPDAAISVAYTSEGGSSQYGIYVNGSGSNLKLNNSIVSGNSNNPVNPTGTYGAYNTLGTDIYFDNSGTSKGTNGYAGCTSVAYSTSAMESMCNYVAPLAPTAPFADEECRTYGMSIGELRTHAGGDPILLAELLQDEHLQPRGWKSLNSNCLTCFSDNLRTYQGAVEGGTTRFSGKKFDVELSRQVGLCVGGELSDPYIDIMLFDSDTHEPVASGSLSNYSIAMNRVDTTNNTITIIEKAIDSMAFTLLADTAYYRYEKPKSGIYQVNVYRQENGKTAEVEHSTITVESLGSTALAWTGAANNGDFNDLDNWVYLEDNGKYVPLTPAQKNILKHPSACYDVHIGWAKPVANQSYTDGKVDSLPTIKTTFPNPADGGATSIQYGECHDIYFHPNGSLGQIHKLSYNKAFVEMELTPYGKNSTSQAWSLLAPPLKEVYSGDYYRDTMYSYMRYVRLKNDNGLKATWSVSIPTLDIDLTNMHTGFAFRFSHSNGAMDNYIYEFPNTRTDYTYYNENTHAEAGNTSVKKSDLRHRFITEDENNVFIENWAKDIDLANNTDFRESAAATGNLTNATGYIAIANPYMSHLDLDAFLEDNKDVIENTAQLFIQSNQSFVSYTQNTSGGKNDNMTKYVSPMQTFWIKPKTLAASISLNFNAAHISVAAPTDEVKNKLRNSEAKANMLKMTVQYGENTSPVRYVYAAPNASNGFKSEEDVPFILGQSDPVDIYTQTDEINLSMNMVDADGLTDLNIPVSVHTLKSGSVTVRIDGVENFEEADDIFWVDAEKNTKESLLETKKFTYNLAKGETEGRFSILFKQKKRVKMETSGSVCQGDAYTFYGQPVGTATPGKVSSRIVREGADADTAFSITLKVNPIYFVDVEATINEGEDYTENGFSILNAKAGSYEKKLFLDSREGCDSIITLKLTVNPTLYKALVYNGTDEPVEKWVTEDGTGLGLTGNALAYFEDIVPDALCSMTNVICKNGGSYSASKISLTADADFYAPYTFTADEIEFSHKPVAASEANGWQTIVLPFTATDFRNSGSADGMAAGRLTPFNESDARKSGDFWLKAFSSSTVNGIGFGYPQASELKANTPYIVAYPGSSYGSKYSLEGQTITYSASSAVVEKTPSPIIKELGDYSVIGVTASTEVKNAYMLDVEKNSFCLAESGTAAPFTCYVLSEGGARTRSLTIYDDDEDDDRILTDTDGLTADGPALFAVIVKEKMAYIYASKAGKADVTDMTGRKVLRSVDYGKGMTAVGTLPAGAYIIGGVKTVIK